MPFMLPLKSDFVFKLVFGDKRRIPLLTAFLQAVLDLPPEEYEKVTLIDPNVKREYKRDKAGVLDVKIYTTTGRVIDVEIQIEPNTPLVRRVLFYQAKMLTEQIGEGDDYDVIKPIITIVITDFAFVPHSKQYHHRFRFYDAANGVEFSDVQEIHTIELPKLPKQPDGSELFDWVDLLKAQNEEDYMATKKKTVFEEVIAVVKKLSADEKVRAEYEQHEKWRMDYSATMRNAARIGRAEGLAEGRAEGLAEGRAEGRAEGLAEGRAEGKEEGRAEGREQGVLLGRINTAKTLKKLGIPTATIIAETGLSPEEIETL